MKAGRGTRDEQSKDDTPPAACAGECVKGVPQGDSRKGIPVFNHNRPSAIKGEGERTGEWEMGKRLTAVTGDE